MSQRSSLFALTAVLSLGAALPAAASTLPRPDFPAGRPTLGVGIGQGFSVSIDAPVAPVFSLGASVGYIGYSTDTRFDVRGLYKFVNGGRHGLTVDGILGGVFDRDPFGNFFQALEIGVGLAYPFTDRFSGRLNLIVPYNGTFLAGRPTAFYDTYFYGPAGGFELGYKFTPTLEGTIGANGMGNLLGLKLEF